MTNPINVGDKIINAFHGVGVVVGEDHSRPERRITIDFPSRKSFSQIILGDALVTKMSPPLTMVAPESGIVGNDVSWMLVDRAVSLCEGRPVTDILADTSGVDEVCSTLTREQFNTIGRKHDLSSLLNPVEDIISLMDHITGSSLESVSRYAKTGKTNARSSTATVDKMINALLDHQRTGDDTTLTMRVAPSLSSMKRMSFDYAAAHVSMMLEVTVGGSPDECSRAVAQALGRRVASLVSIYFEGHPLDFDRAVARHRARFQ